MRGLTSQKAQLELQLQISIHSIRPSSTLNHRLLPISKQ